MKTTGDLLSGDLLVDLDAFLDERAPCDADLAAHTNGANEWLALREFADEMRDCRDEP
jgi:hypothetical protein